MNNKESERLERIESIMAFSGDDARRLSNDVLDVLIDIVTWELENSHSKVKHLEEDMKQHKEILEALEFSINEGGNNSALIALKEGELNIIRNYQSESEQFTMQDQRLNEQIKVFERTMITEHVREIFEVNYVDINQDELTKLSKSIQKLKSKLTSIMSHYVENLYEDSYGILKNALIILDLEQLEIRSVQRANELQSELVNMEKYSKHMDENIKSIEAGQGFIPFESEDEISLYQLRRMSKGVNLSSIDFLVNKAQQSFFSETVSKSRGDQQVVKADTEVVISEKPKIHPRLSRLKQLALKLKQKILHKKVTDKNQAVENFRDVRHRHDRN